MEKKRKAMKKFKNKISPLFFIIAVLVLFIPYANGQEKKDISEMTKEEVLNLSVDELAELPIEDLMKLADIVGVSVDELMDLTINAGAIGGFGKQLEDLDLDVYIHGYAAVWYRTLDLNRVKDAKTFSMHYFNPMLGVNVNDKVIAELMMEYEHGGDDVGIRYGIIDYAFSKYVTLRAGKFLMPLGKFNEYIYPEHINIFADRPISHWNIIPSVYSDIGAQLRGSFPFGNEMRLNYAFYVVNGLEQKAQSNKVDSLNIRKMRNNYRDYSDNGMSYGGRVGYQPLNGAEIGFSYYTGPYSSDGQLDITMVCIDAEYKFKSLALRGEYVEALQDTIAGSITKNGFFGEAAYRINKYIEPAIRYEQATLPLQKTFDGVMTEDVQKVSFGLIIYPEPELISRFNFKVNYNYILNDGRGVARNEFILQMAIGF